MLYNDAVRAVQEFIKRGDTTSPEFRQARLAQLNLSRLVIDERVDFDVEDDEE
jgi:hypothetical protein